MVTTAEALARGLDSYERGALQEAEELFRQVLQAEPQNAEAHYHLGRALRGQGRLREAVAGFQQALLCRPDFAEAYSALGATFQKAVQDPPDAVRAVNKTSEVLKTSEVFDNDLGAVLPAPNALHHPRAPIPQTVQDRSTTAEKYGDLAYTHYCQGRLEEALAGLRQALRLNPHYAEAHHNMAVVLRVQGKQEEALACSQEALRLKPDYAEAHLFRSQTLLYFGDFERGWPEYEWRWRRPGFATSPLPYPKPAWDGSALRGRTILLRAEQGLGDTLQFVRYSSLLQQREGKVIVQSQPPLVPVLRTCPGIDRVIAQGEMPPPFDVHALLLSLPAVLGTTLTTVPADVPYLFADPALVARWREELSAAAGYKVGIFWQGSPEHEFDHLRSVPLLEFAPLAKLEGVHLFGLQIGAGTEQIRTVADRIPLTDLGSHRIETFMDTAAILMNLDLVITVDTALAHLAGALGVPVWVVLSLSPDWRWVRNRNDSPWYPSMRLFRQTQAGDYTEVFETMAAELAKRLAQPPL